MESLAISCQVSVLQFLIDTNPLARDNRQTRLLCIFWFSFLINWFSVALVRYVSMLKCLLVLVCVLRFDAKFWATHAPTAKPWFWMCAASQHAFSEFDIHTICVCFFQYGQYCLNVFTMFVIRFPPRRGETHKTQCKHEQQVVEIKQNEKNMALTNMVIKLGGWTPRLQGVTSQPRHRETKCWEWPVLVRK